MEPDLPPPLDAFVAAVNAGDSDRALGFFLPDGVVEDWGRRFAGPKAIRGWSDREFIGARGRPSVEDIAVTGNTVIVDGDWRSTFYSGHSRIIFTLRDGRIAQMRIPEEE
jgi:hypothetical protein